MRAVKSVYVDSSGAVYFADAGNHRIRRFTQFADYQVTKVIGTGVYTSSGENMFIFCSVICL